MQPASVKMVMNRDYVLTSVYGHSIRFVKDKPTNVPRVVMYEARAAGAIAANEEDASEVLAGEDNQKLRNDEVPKSQDEIRDILYGVFAKLEERNERGDFNASGKPSISAVREFIDFEISAKDSTAFWNEYAQGASTDESDESDDDVSPGLEG